MKVPGSRASRPRAARMAALPGTTFMVRGVSRSDMSSTYGCILWEKASKTGWSNSAQRRVGRIFTTNPTRWEGEYVYMSGL